MSIRALWISDHEILPVMRHSHDFYQLIYCRSGNGMIGIGEAIYEATAGKAYLVMPMELHFVAPKDGLSVIEAKFTVEDGGLDTGLRLLPAEMNVDGCPLLRRSLFDILREGTSGAPYSHEATGAALTLFLVRLLREYGISASDPDVQSCYLGTSQKRTVRTDRDADFLKALDYIEHHLAEEITLDDLCELVGFERSYLITRFKKSFGLSPMRYVGAMRIEQAKHLLLTTDKSVTEIAYETGFGSIHYFSRYFGRTVGLSPNEYRERKRGKEGMT